MTGVLASEVALAILKDEHKLEEGGVYTVSLLGQSFVSRLGDVGFKFETKLVDA